MGSVKQNCHYIPSQPAQFRLRGVHPDWEMHPSYVSAIESLDAYNHWVCEVLLPIAFQWIEEHKPEVYASVPEDAKDDVGVVIASAFDLIKNLKAYQDGLKESAQYEASLANGTFDSKNTNPVWASIAQDLRTATSKAFATKSTLLKQTIK